MRNFRRLGAALTLSVFIGAGMVAFGPTLHAAVPGSPHSVAVRCQLLQSAINIAVETFGADSDLVAYLQGLYAASCVG